MEIENNGVEIGSALKPNQLISNKMYDILKWLVQFFLPACGTLYFTISNIWHLPLGEEVVGTFAALATFIGIIIGISNKRYTTPTEGDMVVYDGPEGTVYKLVLEGDVEELANKDHITFKVVK